MKLKGDATVITYISKYYKPEDSYPIKKVHGISTFTAVFQRSRRVYLAKSFSSSYLMRPHLTIS